MNIIRKSALMAAIAAVSLSGVFPNLSLVAQQGRWADICWVT
jgi:hypothetical protein